MADAFDQVLAAAVDDILDSGFDSQDRVAHWMGRLRRAAEASMISVDSLEDRLRAGMTKRYAELVDRGGFVKLHPGVERFTLERVRPALRAELDRRIMAAADLIKLNRKQAIDKTLQRFAGWSTSIPKGGVSGEGKREVKKTVKKSLAQLPFEERRVLIDQGHKLVSSINEIVATDGGAIAGVWRSHWRQAGYNYREDHKERDEQVYLVRDSWAHAAGLVKKGPAGYYDEVTAPGQEPFCRCYMVWLYNLRDLPEEMLTAKGRKALDAARARIDTARADSAAAEVSGLSDIESSALSRARALDRLGYLDGVSAVRSVPDRDQWNAQYDDRSDAIELQHKIRQKPHAEVVHILLHEIGHRGQEVDRRTFQAFRRAHLARMRSFLAMANEVHLEDFARRGKVDGGAPAEIFAESYARAMTGAEMPEELRRFWLAVVARKRRLVTPADARYAPVWQSVQTRCQRCSMFLPVRAGNVGNACSAVSGEINRTGHCDLFEAGHRADGGEDAPAAIGAEAMRLRLARIGGDVRRLQGAAECSTDQRPGAPPS